jgi:CO/xanthine dehydrogenase Mo-binding subunit
MPSYKYINTVIPKVGAEDLAQGRSAFSADMDLQGPLVLRVLRSTASHAKILDLAISKGLKIPGVVGILTAKDIPGEPLYGLIQKDQPLLADDRVRFRGEAIALVAAEDEWAAEQALNTIHVDYEPLGSVFDPEEALQQGAPLVHEKGNLLYRRYLKKGDIEEGFSRSRVRVKRNYFTPCLEHCYLEPDAGTGYVDKDGELVIYASTQNPHYDQQDVCRILGLQPEQVRIIQQNTGGAFGSKLDLTTQGFIGLALYHFRRPVRLVYTREEAFQATSKRHPFRIEMESGANEKGRVVALKARCVCDTGAYASYGMAVAIRAAVHATGPYEIENVDVECLCVYTNNPVAGAMRGFGAPQMAVAYESQMDLMAQELDIDPLEFRKRNALRVGSRTATGQKLDASVGILSALEAVEPYYNEALDHWKREKAGNGKKRGIGLGAMWYGIGNTGVKNPASARIKLESDGTVVLYTGAADIGQGSTTVLSQIAAEILDTDLNTIRRVVGDTALTESAGATSASRQTYISGNAVMDAAEKLRLGLLAEATDILRTPGEYLTLEEGFVVNKNNPGHRISVKDLAKKAYNEGRTLSYSGHFDPETTPLDPETGQGVPYATYAFACQMALVEVDAETGSVEVSQVIAAHDVGKAIHPQNVEGQIQGGVAMGLGFALMEEFKPGVTSSMADYHIPTSLDMPAVVPIIVEDEEPTGPFGAKGVGEPALIPTAPAILNGITNATGSRIYQLPANPERVRQAISHTEMEKTG